MAEPVVSVARMRGRGLAWSAEEDDALWRGMRKHDASIYGVMSRIKRDSELNRVLQDRKPDALTGRSRTRAFREYAAKRDAEGPEVDSGEDEAAEDEASQPRKRSRASDAGLKGIVDALLVKGLGGKLGKEMASKCTHSQLTELIQFAIILRDVAEKAREKLKTCDQQSDDSTGDESDEDEY